MEIAILIALGSAVNFVYNLSRHKKAESAIGPISDRAINYRFSAFHKATYIVGAWIIALGYGLYLTATNHDGWSGYYFVGLLLSVLSAYPMWRISIGKDGFVIMNKAVKWPSVIDMEVRKTKRYSYLIVKWVEENRESNAKIHAIRAICGIQEISSHRSE